MLSGRPVGLRVGVRAALGAQVEGRGAGSRGQLGSAMPPPRAVQATASTGKDTTGLLCRAASLLTCPSTAAGPLSLPFTGRAGFLDVGLQECCSTRRPNGNHEPAPGSEAHGALAYTGLTPSCPGELFTTLKLLQPEPWSPVCQQAGFQGNEIQRKAFLAGAGQPRGGWPRVTRVWVTLASC